MMLSKTSPNASKLRELSVSDLLDTIATDIEYTNGKYDYLFYDMDQLEKEIAHASQDFGIKTHVRFRMRLGEWSILYPDWQDKNIIKSICNRVAKEKLKSDIKECYIAYSIINETVDGKIIKCKYTLMYIKHGSKIDCSKNTHNMWCIGDYDNYDEGCRGVHNRMYKVLNYDHKMKILRYMCIYDMECRAEIFRRYIFESL